MLGSKKGKGGGYFLDIPPKKIKLAEVLRLIDGPIALLPCLSLHFYEKCKHCWNEQDCNLHCVVCEVKDANLALLEKKLLKIFPDYKKKRQSKSLRPPLYTNQYFSLEFKGYTTAHNVFSITCFCVKSGSFR